MERGGGPLCQALAGWLWEDGGRRSRQCQFPALPLTVPLAPATCTPTTCNVGCSSTLSSHRPLLEPHACD